MSSNQANAVTSPTKVKELAGMFSVAETPKQKPSSAIKKQEPIAARKSFALGKQSILIEDKNSTPLPAPAKPGTKVGEIAKNYHHPHPNPPKSSKPNVASTPAAKTVSRSNSKPEATSVNGDTPSKNETKAPLPVIISSWEESKVEEFQQPESVRARAARMNSHQDSVDATKAFKPAPGKLPATATSTYSVNASAPPIQENHWEPEPANEREFDRQEERRSLTAEEDGYQPEVEQNYLHSESEPMAVAGAMNGYQDERGSERAEEDRQDDPEPEPEPSFADGDRDDAGSDRGFESKEENAAGDNAEATYDKGLYSGTGQDDKEENEETKEDKEQNENDLSKNDEEDNHNSAVSENDNETRSDDRAEEGNVHSTANDNETRSDDRAEEGYVYSTPNDNETRSDDRAEEGYVYSTANDNENGGSNVANEKDATNEIENGD